MLKRQEKRLVTIKRRRREGRALAESGR